MLIKTNRSKKKINYFSLSPKKNKQITELSPHRAEKRKKKTNMKIFSSDVKITKQLE